MDARDLRPVWFCLVQGCGLEAIGLETSVEELGLGVLHS